MHKNQESSQKNKIYSFTQMEEVSKRVNKSRFGGDEVREVEAVVDLIYPSVPFPSNKIFKALGEEKIRAMVWHHHKLLKKTKVGQLFPANEEAFNMAVNKSADFFVEMLGGDEVFTSVHGEPHLRMRHFKIPIDENDREIWLGMFKKTLKDVEFPHANIEEFWNWIEPLSIRMINRRTTMQAINRHPWSQVKKEFGL